MLYMVAIPTVQTLTLRITLTEALFAILLLVKRMSMEVGSLPEVWMSK